ncbi:MAG: hypothetical protein GX117_05050 [Candidatus Hydrogenedentes bacterium]|jgi:hypothetical protein|nr:hypothetical protein [Candidatus Hydrogenedentota bacterium]
MALLNRRPLYLSFFLSKASTLIVPIFLCLTAIFAYPLAAVPLHKKAEIFEYDMQERFLLEGQALCKLKLPTQDRDFIAYNMPDNAYMTGIYTAALAMKYAVTASPADHKAALQSLEALHLLCSVSGTPGVPARAAWPIDKANDDDGIWRDSPCGKYSWRGDVSTDQVAGLLFGFAFAYDLTADDAEKERIKWDVTAIVDRICKHEMQIVDVDDKPTRWGRYGPKYVMRGEAMNALLWLQALKVAAHVTKESYYENLYKHWAEEEQYLEIASKARRMAAPRFVNYSDDVLLFLAYLPLLVYETEENVRVKIQESLNRTWIGTDKFPGKMPEQNPLFAFLAAKYLGDKAHVEGALETLQQFPFDMKWNQDTLESYTTKFELQLKPIIPKVDLKEGDLVPMAYRSKAWSAWVQNPYYSAGDRSKDDPMEFNGHDYLLAYWMGRYFSLIDETK